MFFIVLKCWLGRYRGFVNLVNRVVREKIDQQGPVEGNKADGEYRYCNGRRYCHYSGPYTGHASSQWPGDPSDGSQPFPKQPSLSHLIISTRRKARLGMDSSCAASQCGLRAVGRPSHIVDLSSAGGAWHSRLVMVGGGRFDKKRMAALSALIGARGDCAASGDIK